MARFTENVVIDGSLTATSITSTSSSFTNAMCSANMELARTKLAQDTLQPFSVPHTIWRVHDAITSFLPATAATDDLGFDGGTFATSSPHITAGDLKAAGATTRYMRGLLYLPAEYDDGATCNLQFHAGMQTTVADVSCTIDVECYRSDEETGISADLCTTSATTINSLTFADVSFTLTPTTFVSGDTLDVRVSIICNDAATGTVVEPTIGATNLLCDIRG